ncbi:uncharacterized protein LOC134532740 [Bacillus rossius redtenbacheri]|uniref:uncharacterized protein LOC134532740 n=1 Tax=Bacillus rossius redtenbacheri TaxID=93214 RepID=UPI002FDEDC63
MDLRFMLAAGLLAVAASADVFHYQASVWTGTSVAMTTLSRWSIRGRVTVVGDRVQVTHTNVSVYSRTGTSTPEHYYVPLPKEASQLEQPFVLRYDGGKLAGLSVVSGEAVWAVNMKRGLASLLHLEHDALLTPVLTAEENLLHGVCTVEYTSYPMENITLVRKFVDHEMCSKPPQKILGNCVPILCSDNPQTAVRSSSDAAYRTRVRDGTVELLSVVAVSRTYYHLLRSHASHVITANQSLEKEVEEDHTSSIKIPDNMTHVGMTFELPSKDLTQGRHPESQQSVYIRVSRALDELSGDLDRLQVGADPDEHHRSLVASAVDLLLLADAGTLRRLFHHLDLGTSYRQETARNIFVDILPKVGSHESALVMRDLIIDKKVRNTTAIYFLTYLPFYVREPTEDLLGEMQALLTVAKDSTYDVKSAMVLSFSNLVSKTCKEACSPETLDYYIRYFLDCFTGNKKYQDQVLCLDALANIEAGSVFAYLASIGGGRAALPSPHAHHLRYRALWAAASGASSHPDQVRKLCWPVLTNRSEPLDLRVAALTTLAISDPAPGMFANLFSYMQGERDAHLYYHYHTMLRSLADTTFPCYKELGSLARKFLPVAREPVEELWGSGNYILDFSDAEQQFGSVAHLLMVANKRTGLPNVLHLFLGTHASDHITSRTELLVRMEGVEIIVKEKLMHIFNSTSSIPQLMGLLDKLDLRPVAAERLHIELALNLQGLTVLSQVTNLSNWKELLKELWALTTTQFGAHLNHQQSQVVLLNGRYFPTGAGTLVATRARAVGLTSLRGDVAWSPGSLLTDVDVSMFHSTVYEMTTFNPILNMWQAAEMHQTVRGHLIINNRLDVSPSHFKLSLYRPTGSSAGLVWHSRTKVSVKGREAARTLRSLCPECDTVLDVVTGNKGEKTKQILNIPIPDAGSRLQVHVLQCDMCPNEGSTASMLLSVLDKNTKNYRVLPSSRPYLVLLHFAVHALVAPPGDIAGYSVQLVSTHNELTKLELTARLDVSSYLETRGDGPVHFKTLLAHNTLHNDTSLWAWEMTGQLTVPLQFDSYSIDAELTKYAVGKPTYSVCVQLGTELQKSEEEFSLRSLLSNVLKSRGTVSWGRLGNDTLSCPDGGGRLEVAVAAETSHEQKEAISAADRWPYNTCPQANEEPFSYSGDMMFLDPECSQIISELSTPRAVTATIKYTTVENEDTINSLPHSAGSQTKKLDITAEFPLSRHEMELTVNDYQVSSSMGATLVLPWLSRKLLPAADSISSDWTHTCIINASNVRTYDNAFIKTAVPTCYIVGTAERTQNPTFSVMVRTRPGSNQLALKIYSGSNYIEITSRDGCTTIVVNDKLVMAEERIKTVSNFGLHINKKGGTDIIAPPVIVAYTTSSVTINISPLLYGDLTGVCGDYNGDSSNDHSVHSIMTTCPLE